MKDKIYNISQRMISMLLSIVMVISFFPSHVFAVDGIADTVRVIVENKTYSKSEGAVWDGVLIDEEIPIDNSTTMMSAVKQAIESNGYTQTGAETNYLSEINGLKSGTVTAYSGWMGTLNDWFTNEGFGAYTVADGTLVAGDEIRIMYSLDMGEDCGGSWNNNETTVKSIDFSVGQLEKPFEIGVVGQSYTNKLIVSKGTNEVVVRPTATNKNFQVKTFVGDKEYKLGQKIPVTNGTVIKVKCGDPSWPTMNNNYEIKATEYSFEVSVHNSVPTLKNGVDKEVSSKIVVGNNYTIDLSKIFEDADKDKLTYNVKVNGSQPVIANEQYSYKCDNIGTTVLEFTANDSISTSESYKVNLTVKENSAPSIKEDISNKKVEFVSINDEFKLDLSEIFEDEDSDILTYSVKVNDAEAKTINKDYSYTVTNKDRITLVFTANDGKSESETYTVILTEEKYATLDNLIIYSAESEEITDKTVLIKNENDNYSTEVVFNKDKKDYVLPTTVNEAFTTALNFSAKSENSDNKIYLEYTDKSDKLQKKNITLNEDLKAYKEDFLVAGENNFNIIVEGDEFTKPTTYSFTVSVMPSLASLSVESDIKCYTEVFDSKKFETTVILPKNTETITINADTKSDDSTITFNGEQSNTINVSQIDKIEIAVFNDSVKTVYNLKLDKKDLIDFNFKTNVDNASITVYDRDKNQIYPNSDGIYSAMTSAVEHTYKISKNGYVTKTGVVSENGGEIYVELVKPEGEQPQEVNAFWPSFRGNEFNMGITSARTPQTEDKANIYAKWTKKLGKSWSESPSAQIIVDNSLIVMAGKKLYKLDLNTGDILAQSDMVESPNWGYTPPTYGNGMIFCPLNNSTIQAFNAKTLEPLWIYKDEFKGQSLSSITYSDGYIYTGFWNGETRDSNYVCISTTDEDVNSKDEEKSATWTYKNKGGFYWAGSVVVGDAVIFGMDNGAEESEFDVKSKICSFNKYTGEIISQLEITGDQRSSITYDKELGRIYFTTKSGYLYRADINAQTGELSNLKYSSSFNKQSTSTPVVYKGRVYSATGGGVGAKGEIVVADAESLETLFTVGLKGYPQGSVLLSNAYEAQTGYIYLYSTYNAMPGGIYALKLKADCQSGDDVELVEIYDAKGFENYCISSIICGNDGTLYYKNDSGNVFAVGIPDSTNVEKLINSIGEVTISSKGLISAARGAYEALDDSDKQNVKNYDVLLKAESTYVEKLIEDIGIVTINSKQKIENARMEYDALSSELKQNVKNYDALVKAEKDYIDLQKAFEVDKKIEEIGKVTLISYDKILNVRKAYNELTLSEKSFVSKYDVLVAAEVEYEKLEKEAISNVEGLINKIGNVTLESEGKINEARNAYNALPSHIQKKVSNYDKLEQAEIALNKLKNTNNNVIKPTQNKKPSKEKVVLNKAELLVIQSKFEKVNEETSYNDALDLIKTYYKLSEEQQLALADTEELKLIQNIIAKENHKDKQTGISISDIPWNVKISITLADKEKINSEISDKLNNKVIIDIWDIKLIDILTNEEYVPENIVTIKTPVELVPSIKDYDELSILHYKNKDNLEFLSCKLVDDAVEFKASEFSYYGIVGTKVSEQKDNSETIVETPQMTNGTNNGITWVWWAVVGGLLIVVLGILIVIKRKTTHN